MKHLPLLLIVCAIFLASCNTSKKTVINVPETEYRDLDTMVVVAPPLEEDESEMTYELPRYNPSAKRVNDLLHTKLELGFDWEKEQVIGKATLTFKPYFYDTDSLTLDAKGFEFNSIRFANSSSELKYEYDGQQVKIDLGRPYKRTEEYKVFIDYIATPSQSGGSAAITSDKGLFFINPRGEEGDKPKQIWTQGETENNSRWFPTIDKPNERTTQEVYLTVADEYETLSNGLLISSTKNSDGTRTDYWKMDDPHAPYLFMLTIGDFAVVKDDWNGMLVDYYVEKKYKDSAKDIFPYTPEMLTFFSDKLGVKYPWAKYSQVAVRDFVSGAMENTTAVIFGEFMNGTKRDLLDNLTNEKIVAHEMMHHWFGDYVTTESWANLTLNEGFANYSEYMWLEKKHGKDEADYHLMNELGGYLGSAQNGGIHPLIHFGYDDKEEMFDAHSYNYGGLVLHMLRNYLGDEAFFAALDKYLTDNKYSPVEVHELRMAFEDTVGEDLNWFFNQWFLEQGHPEMDITYGYDASTQMVSVQVAQMQDPELMPAIFQMPVAIDIYTADGKKIRKDIMVNERTENFSFKVDSQPKLINFDADNIILGISQDNKGEEEYIFQYRNAPMFADRFEAIQNLKDSEGEEAKAVLKEALKDKFYAIRGLAVQNVDLDASISSTLENIAKNDPHSQVRGATLVKLAESGDAKYISVAKSAIDNDQSYDVISAGLQMLNNIDQEAALTYATKLEKEENGAILAGIGQIYMTNGNNKYLAFFENNWNRIEGFDVISFIDNYGQLAAQQDMPTIMDAAQKLKKMAIDMNESPWRRFASTKAINDLHGTLFQYAADDTNTDKVDEVKANDDILIKMINEIKATETNGQLKGFYVNFPNPPARP